MYMYKMCAPFARINLCKFICNHLKILLDMQNSLRKYLRNIVYPFINRVRKSDKKLYVVMAEFPKRITF